MGRARSNMNFIENEKVRVVTYRKRRKSLLKKAEQLATLCDIQVCVIMSGPKLSDNAPKPLEAFSENPKEPSVVIQNFKIAIENKKHRDLTISDVLKQNPKTNANNNNNNDEEDNLRFWFEHANKFPSSQLEELIESITAKLRYISVIEEDRRANFANVMFPNNFGMSPMGNFMYPSKLEAGPSTYGRNVSAIQEYHKGNLGNFKFPSKLEAGPSTYGRNVSAVQKDRKGNFGNFMFHDEIEAGLGTFGRNVNSIQKDHKGNLGNLTFPNEFEAGPGIFDPNFNTCPPNHVHCHGCDHDHDRDHYPNAYQLMPPPRPHGDHSNSIGRFTNWTMSDNSEFSSQFTDQGVSFNDEASNNMYIPYNVPQYNGLDLFGISNNNNNNQIVQNPNAPMWEQKFGGFNG